MSRWVLDASVLVKLFVDEIGSSDVAAALKPTDELIAPDLIWAEAGNVLRKYVRRGALAAADAEGILADMLQMPIETTSARDLIEPALAIAAETDRAVYALYLAMAAERRCRLLTADERLVNALAATRFAKHVRHVAKKR